MVGSYRDSQAYEPLRRNDILGTGGASTPTPSNRHSDRTLADAGQPPLDRPVLGTPSTGGPPSVKTNTPSGRPRSSHHTAPLDSSTGISDRDWAERRSLDAKNPLLNSKRSLAPTTRPGSAPNPRYSEDMDDPEREPGSYFEHATPSQASPSPQQFLANRGRPMSFYDMKEQREQKRPPPLGSQKNSAWRQSWRSNEMPYNYADMIGGNRYNYAPPRMGMNAAAPGRGGPGGGPEGAPQEAIPLRLPWTMWMNSEAKNLFVAGIGEWVGTTMFLFFAFAGTQVANAKSQTPAESTTTNATTGFDPQVMMYIALSFGFSLMVNVWVFFRISGGLFNPAVTLALWTTGALNVSRAITLFISQIVGSITASALVLALFPTPLNVRTTLSDGTSLAQGLFIEAFMTAELVFTILMLAKEKHRATFIAPVGIGLALFVAELVGVYYTGGSLNPARSIGPCIVARSFDPEHWIYWVGPGLGCLFAIGFYKVIKILEYEMANPGQDGDDLNDPTKNPHHEVREKQREVTARILASLGFDSRAAHQAARDNEVQRMAMAAEEGGGGVYYSNGSHNNVVAPGRSSFMGNSSTVMGDDSDRESHRVVPFTMTGATNLMNAPGPLSTVASMSEASPTRPYAPSRTSMQADNSS
ncbi:aquaporin-like protein [Xylariomycetidae sp. FL2044]|nr:aquaporin-like protein [Xylariomycetidae sp. FL2044]